MGRPALQIEQNECHINSAHNSETRQYVTLLGCGRKLKSVCGLTDTHRLLSKMRTRTRVTFGSDTSRYYVTELGNLRPHRRNADIACSVRGWQVVGHGARRKVGMNAPAGRTASSVSVGRYCCCCCYYYYYYYHHYYSNTNFTDVNTTCQVSNSGYLQIP